MQVQIGLRPNQLHDIHLLQIQTTLQVDSVCEIILICAYNLCIKYLHNWHHDANHVKSHVTLHATSTPHTISRTITIRAYGQLQ